jgi:hypothetical protein
MISGGREMSREQLSHFKESLCSKVEDDGTQEAVLQDEDGKMGGASRNSPNAEGHGAVKSEELPYSPGPIDDPIKGASSGSSKNLAKAKRGIFGGRPKSSKSTGEKSEGGIKVLHNPRVSLGECF